MNVQQPVEPVAWPFQSIFGEGPIGEDNTGNSGYPTGSPGLDVISRLIQGEQQMQQVMPLSPLSLLGNPMSMFQQAGSWLQQAGSSFQNWLSGTPDYGSEQYYSSASGGSSGDPHISFNGNTWNDMQSEPDLLHSDSIPGGYQLSTQTTTPNANGVTYNQSATVTTNGGRSQVTLDNNGNATISQNGITTNLNAGQTVQLRNDTVARNQDGSLQITTRNENGGQITTTMRQNGQGVDVNVSASNVDLGGAMVNGSSSSSQPQPPWWGPEPLRRDPIEHPWPRIEPQPWSSPIDPFD